MKSINNTKRTTKKNEPLPCIIGIPLIGLLIYAITLMQDNQNEVGIILAVTAAILATIIQKTQFWISKPKQRKYLHPEYNYKDYVTICKRNGRRIMSGEEWHKWVRLDEEY